MFLDMSAKKLQHVKSEDSHETSTTIMTYDKGVHPVFERVLSRATEQGLYKYWSKRMEHLRCVAGNTMPQLQLFLQGIKSNLLSAFVIYCDLLN